MKEKSFTNVLASEGQTVQNKINNIVNLWGGAHPGTTNVSSGTIASRAQINAWKSYLRTLNSRITGNKVSVPPDTPENTIMIKTQLTELYTVADQIASWCNRSECYKSENYRGENHRGERNRSECNHSSENHSGERQGGESH